MKTAAKIKMCGIKESILSMTSIIEKEFRLGNPHSHKTQLARKARCELRDELRTIKAKLYKGKI